MKIKLITRIEGNAKRLTEIVRVLAKYGLADWLSNVDYDIIQSRLKSKTGERLGRLSTPERIRFALAELGTSFIKLGQMLSTRPDLVGAELAEELSKLQAGTTPDDPCEVIATITRELGAPPDELFATFDNTPLASASIGQVHGATLRTGERVVVKIMHAGIEAVVERDLDIIMGLAELMEKHAPGLRQYQPVGTVKSFSRTIRRELNFGYEARHLQQFTTNFRNDPTVHFPIPVLRLSSQRLLTMERLEGVPVSDRDALSAVEEDLTEFARRGVNMYLEMIFRDGFYHADPHPGNLMLLQGGIVGVLDAGMIGRIDDALRNDIESMLLAAVAPDPEELVDIVCRVGSVPPELDRENLKAELANLLADYTNQSVAHFDLGGALNQVIDLIRSYRILLPQGFAMLLKTLVMLEGTGQRLAPDFSLAELLKPYYAKAWRRRLAPSRLMHELMRSYRDWHRLLDTLPRDVADILTRVRRGSFEVHLEHRHLEGTVDRLVKGILTAALFVGSAMILSSEVPPTIRGFSILGGLGCALSFMLGYQLLRAIRRSSTWRDRF